MSKIENDYRDERFDREISDEIENSAGDSSKENGQSSTDEEYGWDGDDAKEETQDEWEETEAKAPAKEGKTIMGYSIPVFAGIMGGILVVAGGATYFVTGKGATNSNQSAPVINQMASAQSQVPAPMVKPITPVNINVSTAPVTSQAQAQVLSQAPAQPSTQIMAHAEAPIATPATTATPASALHAKAIQAPIASVGSAPSVSQANDIQPASIQNPEFREQVKSNMNQLSSQVGKTSDEVGQLSSRMDSNDKKMNNMDAKLDEILKKVNETGHAGVAPKKTYAEKPKPVSPIKGWTMIGYSSNGTAVISTGSGIHTVKAGLKVGDVVIKSVANGVVYTNHGVVR